MTEVLGFLAYLLLPLSGLWVWRIDYVRGLPRMARLAVAMAAGALTITALMAALSLAGIEWSRTVILPLIALIAIGSITLVRRAQPVPVQQAPMTKTIAAGVALCLALVTYGTITARQSCGDLQFTWGPKAIRWFRAGGIDVGVLKTWPQLTVDYPPLQTLLLALSNTFSSHFAWWAAVMAFPLFFAATVAVFHAIGRDGYGTLLFAGVLTYAFTWASPAGCAEPPLLLFETIAILALTFVDDERTATILAALGAAGAVFTKLEGVTFTIALFLTVLLVKRRPKQAFLIVIPAALLFAAWMGFVFANDLLYMYGGAKMPIYWETLPIVLKTLAKVASVHLFWLPFLIPIAVIALGNVRRAAVPLAIAFLTSGAAVYFYVHYPDPVWWIESSAPRVILTPLVALLIAAVAAWRPTDHLS